MILGKTYVDYKQNKNFLAFLLVIKDRYDAKYVLYIKACSILF